MSFQNTKLYCYLIAPNQIQGRRAKLSYNIDGVLLPCIRSFIRLIYPAGILPTYARTSAAGARHRTITSCRCRHRQCIHHIRQRKTGTSAGDVSGSFVRPPSAALSFSVRPKDSAFDIRVWPQIWSFDRSCPPLIRRNFHIADLPVAQTQNDQRLYLHVHILLYGAVSCGESRRGGISRERILVGTRPEDPHVHHPKNRHRLPAGRPGKSGRRAFRTRALRPLSLIHI